MLWLLNLNFTTVSEEGVVVLLRSSSTRTLGTELRSLMRYTQNFEQFFFCWVNDNFCVTGFKTKSQMTFLTSGGYSCTVLGTAAWGTSNDLMDSCDTSWFRSNKGEWGGRSYNAQKIFVIKSEGTTTWKTLTEIGDGRIMCKFMIKNRWVARMWPWPIQFRIQWQTFVNTVVNIWVQKPVGYF